jgi:hypothetical protein
MSREVRAMLVTKRTEDLIIIWETGINNKSLGERSRVINDIQQQKEKSFTINREAVIIILPFYYFTKQNKKFKKKNN